MRYNNAPINPARCRGSVVPWVLISTVAIVGFTALAVDLGHLLNAHVELKAAANAAALAGGNSLLVGIDEARTQAQTYASMNFANGQLVNLLDTDVEFGSWDEASRTFTLIDESDPEVVPDAIRVTTQLTSDRGSAVAHLFGKVLGSLTSDIRVTSTAFFQSRDIMLVLDLSSSMNDDSELRHAGLISQADIEANLFQIWTEMGSPVFGTMQFDPVFIDTDVIADVETALGLTPEPYPFPSGSWEDYIEYVMVDPHLNNVGYNKHYGYMTWVNYLQAKQPRFDQTPMLWQTSEQPITAVKDSVALFLDFLREADAHDFVGLATYTSASGHAVLESHLTENLGVIEALTRKRQAGHYATQTNIGAGIEVAREELNLNGRNNTFPRLIVLLTDGKANRPTNQIIGSQFALSQAQLAGDDGLPILAISIGADADQDLMQDIADLSDGVHFNVPVSGNIEEVAEDLNNIFLQIAAHRRLRLVE